MNGMHVRVGDYVTIRDGRFRYRPQRVIVTGFVPHRGELYVRVAWPDGHKRMTCSQECLTPGWTA